MCLKWWCDRNAELLNAVMRCVSYHVYLCNLCLNVYCSRCRKKKRETVMRAQIHTYTHYTQEVSQRERRSQMEDKNVAKLSNDAMHNVCTEDVSTSKTDVNATTTITESGGKDIKGKREPLNIRIAMISDTHGGHEDLKVPSADVLIHAGDFTRYGRKSDVESFNSWMGAQAHKFKLVVNGNHEVNAPWQKQVRDVLSNCMFLKNQSATILIPPNAKRKKATSLKIYGTDFYWPMRSKNPYYDKIPDDVDILISHGPCKSHVDGGLGCTELRNVVERIKPRLVVSGHIHKAHGTITKDGVTYVNAANAREGHGRIGWPALG